MGKLMAESVQAPEFYGAGCMEMLAWLARLDQVGTQVTAEWLARLDQVAVDDVVRDWQAVLGEL